MHTLVLLIALLGQLSWVAQAQDAPVVPLFSCWFPAYQAGGLRISNLVLSYNNTGNASVALPLAPGQNAITPQVYDGQQPGLYVSGLQLFDFVISDNQDVLATGAIYWALDNTTVAIVASMLVEANRCDQAFNGTCPMGVAGFCEDDTYCNGAETCFSSSQFGASANGAMGTCSAPAEGIVCPAGQLCSEALTTCLATQAPTGAPTEATTAPTTGPTVPPTAAPTTEPTSIAPTAAPTTPSPTAAPTYASIDIPVTVQCWYSAPLANSSDVEPRWHIVLQYNNPTGGVVTRPVTNTLAQGLANLLVPAYNGVQPAAFLPGANSFTLVDTDYVIEMGAPLTWYLGRLQFVVTAAALTDANVCTEAPTPAPPPQCSAMSPDCSVFDSFCNGVATCNVSSGRCIYVNESWSPCPSSANDSMLIVNCLEELQICVQDVSCTNDTQCDDGLFCNGQSYCVNGSCQNQSDTSIVAICGSTAFVCVEGEGCVGLQQYALSNSAILALVIGLSVLAIAVIVISVSLFECSNAKAKRRRNKNKAK